MKFTQHFSTQTTPQSQAIPGSTQVPNSAGGYAWRSTTGCGSTASSILGSEGGTTTSPSAS